VNERDVARCLLVDSFVTVTVRVSLKDR